MKNKLRNKNNSGSIVLKESGGRLAYYFINTVIFIAVPYLLTKFDENSTVIGVLIGILILFFLPINMVEYFFVDEDKLVVLYRKVFFLQFFNRRRIFKYDEIKKITVTLKHDRRTDITAFFIDLTSKFAAVSLNELVVEMKDGKEKYINTQIYKENLLPIINFMQNKGVDIEITYPNQKDI